MYIKIVFRNGGDDDARMLMVITLVLLPVVLWICLLAVLTSSRAICGSFVLGSSVAVLLASAI